MKLNSIVGLLLATSLAGILVPPVKAATFNFSFRNRHSNSNGTVKGRIELPDGDGTFAATSLTITSAPSELEYSLPLDSLNSSGIVLQNTFTVINGEIDRTNSRFLNIFPGFRNAFALNIDILLGFGNVSFLDNSRGGFLGSPGVRDLTSSTLTYTPASVPESNSTFSFLTLGTLTLAIFKYKRIRA